MKAGRMIQMIRDKIEDYDDRRGENMDLEYRDKLGSEFVDFIEKVIDEFEKTNNPVRRPW